jgi:pentatricopeptide repeat protein
VTRKEMLEAGNTLLDGYASHCDVEAAADLFRWLFKHGLGPDKVAYSTLITAYGRAGDLPAARRLFVQMRAARHLPDRVTMNALLGACVHCRSPELAVLIFDEMQRVGRHLAPNLTSYSAMIALYAGDGDVGAAWNMYEELKAKGLVPNERIMERMMAACVSRELSFMSSSEGRWLLQGAQEAVEDAVDGGAGEAPAGVRSGAGALRRELDPATTAAVVEAALDEFDASAAASSELADEMRQGAASLQSGWTSQMVATLLQDMQKITVAEQTRNHWVAAVNSIWSR